MDKEWGIVAAMVVAVGLVCSPLYSIYAVASGMANHDAKKVASYVDFEAVRSSLKARMTAAAFDGAAPDGRVSAGAALGGALGLALADRIVDRMVTPEGLVALFGKARQAQGGTTDFRQVLGRLRINGLTEVDLVSSGDPKAYLVFRTDNFVTWKLVDFVVPDAPSQRKTITETATR